MIPRYSRQEMASIWEPASRFQIWLEIEVLACEAQANLGVIPKEAAEIVRQRGAFEIERIEDQHVVIVLGIPAAHKFGADDTRSGGGAARVAAGRVACDRVVGAHALRLAVRRTIPAYGA